MAARTAFKDFNHGQVKRLLGLLEKPIADPPSEVADVVAAMQAALPQLKMPDIYALLETRSMAPPALSGTRSHVR